MRITTRLMDEYFLHLEEMLTQESKQLCEIDEVYFSEAPLKTVFPIPLFSNKSNPKCALEFRNFCLKWVGATQETALKMVKQNAHLR